MHSFSQCLSWTSCLFLPYRHCWLFLPSRVPPENETKQSITYSARIRKTSLKFPDFFYFPESEFMTCKVVKCVKFSYRLRAGRVWCRQWETNPELSPWVPDDPVLSPVLRHAPTGHRHDVIGQRQRVKLWEDPSRVSFQTSSGHQCTTERQRVKLLLWNHFTLFWSLKF